MPTNVLALDIRGLHAAQADIAASDARFRVVCAGRRFGKTMLAVALAIAEAAKGGRVWWVAPSYKLASVGWREIRRFCGAIPGAEVSLSSQTYTLPGGGWVQVRTAGAVGALRGEGLDFVIYDEAAQGAAESWTDELRPALADRKGRALFISTPRGRANWFHDLFQRGMADEAGEWASWQLPTSANPYIDPDEIAAARADMPRAAAEQEFDALFVDAGTAVFSPADVDAMADGWAGLGDPVAGRSYLTAWDIGRRGDPAVGITVDYSAVPYQVVAFDRMMRVPYPAQQSAIEARDRLYPGKTFVESNGPGDTVIENLAVRVTPFVTTARSKVQAIQALQVLLEHGALKCGVPEVRREMLSYEWDDRSLVQDCVMTLAIAAAHLPKPGKAARIPVTLDLGRIARPELAGIRSEAW